METTNLTNDSLKKQSEDITVELARLVEAGLNETQISRIARLRGTYNTTSDLLTLVPASPLNQSELNRLAFTRWLYSAGRLES